MPLTFPRETFLNQGGNYIRFKYLLIQICCSGKCPSQPNCWSIARGSFSLVLSQVPKPLHMHLLHIPKQAITNSLPLVSKSVGQMCRCCWSPLELAAIDPSAVPSHLMSAHRCDFHHQHMGTLELSKSGSSMCQP